MADSLGWTATAVFAASYFFRRADALRRVQMLGALLWVAYGVLMHALPVVAANLLVLAAAAWTARRSPAAAAAVASAIQPAPGAGPGVRPATGPQ